MFGYYLGYGGLGVWGWILSIAFLAVVVFGVMALVHLIVDPGQLRPAARTWGPHPHGVDPALTELRVRYARGDISWDEYLRRSSDLGAPLTPRWQGPHPWPRSQGSPGARPWPAPEPRTGPEGSTGSPATSGAEEPPRPQDPTDRSS